MSVLDYVLGGILLAAAVFLIIAVLMQEGKSKGIGAVNGGSSDTFFGKTKGKSWDKTLSKLTTIVGVFFAVIVLLVYIIQKDAKYDDFFEKNSSLLNQEETTAGTEGETDINTDASNEDETSDDNNEASAVTQAPDTAAETGDQTEE